MGRSILQKIKPRSTFDLFSLIYALVLIHAEVLFGEFMVLPWLIKKHNIGLFKICCLQVYGAFLYFNVIGNMWKIMITNTSTVGKVLPTLLKPGWYYCTICESNSPPRAFHCSTCNKCILKRDHHCMFTGKCIGYFNHRHYLMLVVYTWLGAMFSIVMSSEFCWEMLGGFSFTNLLKFILPIFAFILGQLDLYTAIVAFLTLLATIFFALLTGLIIYHSKHVRYGIVTYERSHNIYLFDLGFKNNFRSVFGDKWYLAMIFPFFHTTLPGDGIEFQTKDTFERAKDLRETKVCRHYSTSEREFPRICCNLFLPSLELLTIVFYK
ncbi:hypothetical protein KUTeg_021501 [Tegillarca granosa]|uniref:Palmitoyltransferase n=1 Tax=Tegillarca granosa TaxID=220873 RepID=A0ABQ9E8T9_TEGGR|nr:hypothetical protein KUTeg_021501 [Tegillarca granosa]